MRSITAEQLGFPHASQLAKIERTVTYRSGKKKSHEVVWLVTSLPPEKARPEQLLQLIRAYWEIETGVHQRLDVALWEDKCRIRDTHIGWSLGWMRRMVIAEYYQWKPKIQQAREATSPKFLQHNRRHKTMLINLLTSPV